MYAGWSSTVKRSACSSVFKVWSACCSPFMRILTLLSKEASSPHEITIDASRWRWFPLLFEEFCTRSVRDPLPNGVTYPGCAPSGGAEKRETAHREGIYSVTDVWLTLPKLCWNSAGNGWLHVSRWVGIWRYCGFEHNDKRGQKHYHAGS